MELIASIIQAALEELFEKAVLELTPDEIECLDAEVTIEGGGNGMFYVEICGWKVFIWEYAQARKAFFSYSLATDICSSCEVRFCASDLVTVAGRLRCDYCALKCDRCHTIPADRVLHQVDGQQFCNECIRPKNILILSM